MFICFFQAGFNPYFIKEILASAKTQWRSYLLHLKCFPKCMHVNDQLRDSNM